MRDRLTIKALVVKAGVDPLASVATPGRQPDHSAVETKVFALTRELLEELGSPHSGTVVRGSAKLDRDLGLGSLERVELLVRLGRLFGTSLPDRVVAEADTLDEVVAALTEVRAGVVSQPHAGGEHRNGILSAVEPAWAAPPLPQAAGASDAPAWAETWQEVLRYRAEHSAERPHLILCEEDSEAPPISFEELHRGAERVATRLIALGIVRGDAVALMLPTSSEFFLIFAGVLLAGGVPVPIYPPVRADRIAEYAERQSAILDNANARVLVTFREAERVAKLLQPRAPSLDHILTAATLTSENTAPSVSAPRLPATGSADLALMQYTSGSTGNPKGVQLTHANLLANVRAIGEALEIGPGDVGVSWLPLYHDMGLIGAWLMPLYFGLPLYVMSPLSFLTRPERWLRTIHNHRGTLTAAPNFAYELAVRKIADSDIEGLDLSSLRASMNGAEPVNPSTLERFVSKFASYGFRRESLLPVYGLAESSLAVTIPPLGREPRVDHVARELFERNGRAKPVGVADCGGDDSGVLSFVSAGHALSGHDVMIADADGEEAEERVEGELWFRGPSTTSGYFRNEEASAALFPKGRTAGWLDSGDRAYRADGEFFITGRKKDIIFKAGRNLYPHEIEEIAAGVQGVRKGCVVAFGATDAAAGTERVIVVAETQESDASARQRIAREIVEKVAEAIGLPPDSVEMLPPRTIPKTSSGKLRRDQTRRLYEAGKLGAPVPPAWRQAASLMAASATRSLRSWPRTVARELYGIYALALFGLWIVPTWIAVYLAPTRRVAANITAAAVRAYLAVAGSSVRVQGRENLAVGTTRVLVCNHTSYADILALIGSIGVNYHFVAKSEALSWPFIGTFLRKLGHFAFHREDPQDRLRQSDQIEEALRRGESVLVFPEGTFTPQAGVRPFHLGAFKAAVHAGCPIVPLALHGTRRLLRDDTYLPRRTRVTLTISPPLQPVKVSEPDDWKEMVRLRDAARETISRNAGEPLL